MTEVIAELLSEKIAAYILQRKEEKLVKTEKILEKIKKQLAEQETDALKADLDKHETAIIDINHKHQPDVWLTDAAIRAKQIQFVTHAIKYLHSDAKGSSVMASTENTESPYVSTASVKKVEFDVVGNAAALDVGKMLTIEHEGSMVLDFVRRGDMSPLRRFAKDTAQLNQWQEGFNACLTLSEKASHTLAKQLYWPLSDGGYHLLLPLFPSSLAHRMYQLIHENRYDEANVNIRKARRNGEYVEEDLLIYTQLAVQSFGGTKPQNISQLNSQRGGKAYLLSSRPPTWEARIKAPLHYESIFSNYLLRKLYSNAKGLQQFLEKVLKRKNNKKIKDARMLKVERIVRDVLYEASLIQSITPGWSQEPSCKLPKEECLWLDSQRATVDEAFAQAYQENKWQQKVADNFARSLTLFLEDDNMAYGLAEHDDLSKVFYQSLRFGN